MTLEQRLYGAAWVRQGLEEKGTISDPMPLKRSEI